MTRSVQVIIVAGCLFFLAGLPSSHAQDAAALDADVALAMSQAEAAEASRERQQFRSLDEEVQSLKKEVLDLNRDLFLLEEELLFPANSQVAFFISMDVGEYFDLDSVNLKIDGQEVANYLYTEREAGALMRGGVHRVHMGNLKTRVDRNFHRQRTAHTRLPPRRHDEFQQGYRREIPRTRNHRQSKETAA